MKIAEVSAESSPKKPKNSVGKGEIAHYQQFLLSLQCFSKEFYCRHVKTRACVGKGYITEDIPFRL